MSTTDAPWDDIKIAFHCDRPDLFSKADDEGRLNLPTGWSLQETWDHVCGTLVILDCDHIPTREEGLAIKAQCRRFRRRS